MSKNKDLLFETAALEISSLKNEIDLLKRKLELCKKQRNGYIEDSVSEFYTGPNTFEDEIKKVINISNKALEEFITSEGSE